MNAVLSPCGTYRYRLDREIDQFWGVVFGFFGINPSTAHASEDDATIRKWRGFTTRNNGSRFIVGNPFALRSTDVDFLWDHPDPVGPDNQRYLAEIIAEAHILVPCWGNRSKVPPELRHHFDLLLKQLRDSGKPVRIFGLTKSGDPLHPLMLGYDTPLLPWP